MVRAEFDAVGAFALSGSTIAARLEGGGAEDFAPWYHFVRVRRHAGSPELFSTGPERAGGQPVAAAQNG